MILPIMKKIMNDTIIPGTESNAMNAIFLDVVNEMYELIIPESHPD